MLVLRRRIGERVVIDGGRIVVTVVDVSRTLAVLGVEAAPEIAVDRGEIHEAKREAKCESK